MRQSVGRHLVEPRIVQPRGTSEHPQLTGLVECKGWSRQHGERPSWSAEQPLRADWLTTEDGCFLSSDFHPLTKRWRDSLVLDFSSSRWVITTHSSAQLGSNPVWGLKSFSSDGSRQRMRIWAIPVQSQSITGPGDFTGAGAATHGRGRGGCGPEVSSQGPRAVIFLPGTFIYSRDGCWCFMAGYSF